MTIVTGPSAHPLRPEMTEAVLTRRTLLRLLGAPLVLRAAAALTQEADTHLRLWLELDTALKSRDRATTLRDRLEDSLVQAVSYPRVRLPHDRGAPARFTAEVSDIDRTAMSRRLRRRLKAKLRRRQQAWATAAEAAGLAQAIAEEGAAAHAVNDAITALLGTPANTLAVIRLKLAVLLATGAPAAGDRCGSPWGELHLLLADLHRLEGDYGKAWHA